MSSGAGRRGFTAKIVCSSQQLDQSHRHPTTRIEDVPCLIGLRAFRLPVMLQMCGGVLKRCQLRPFLVAVLRLRLILGVFLFCVRPSKDDRVLERFTVMDSRWWLVCANCRADAQYGLITI